MSPDGVVRLSFPARPEYLILGRLALAGVARAVPIADETLADLKLAVTEACGNVVRHAYPDADREPPGAVHLTIVAERESLTITVEDDGVGLSPEPITDESAGEPPNGESGMGLAIIAAIADELEVRRAGPAGGTLLRLRKLL